MNEQRSAKLILHTFVIGLLVLPSSTNYKMHNYGIGSGGEADSSSSNYRLNAITGEVSEDQLTGSSYNLGPGLQQVRQANVPPAPTLVNDGSDYNKLHLTLDNGGNPSDAVFAIAISTDAFASETKYVQSDNTVGDTLGSEDYQTYTAWGGASGDYITGLEPSTTYTVKVKAMHGDFTETGYGPTDDAATVGPQLSFDIDVSSTDQETSSPYAIDMGSLTAGSVTDSSDKIWIDLDTNAESGGRVYLSGGNAGLHSNTTAYTISAVTGDLAALSEGFGAQGDSVSESSGGPLGITTLYDKASDNVGTVDTTIRDIFETSAEITGGRGSFIVKAKSSSVTPAAGDYTETITVIASASY